MIKKVKAILQWIVQLELQEHNHWCPRIANYECRHSFAAWHCSGVFCANQEKKLCIECEALLWKRRNLGVSDVS